MTTSCCPTVSIPADPTNPGQFFACCGLLELACRTWGHAEGWFEPTLFHMECNGHQLAELLLRYQSSLPTLETGTASGDDTDDDEDDDDGRARPIELALPMPLRLDWWADRSLKTKTWAGSMDVHAIYRAMTRAIDPSSQDPLNDCSVVFDPSASEPATTRRKQKKAKKREPFYFDARRGSNARSLDVGFATDKLEMTSVAFPAVESLCLVGLQRFRPLPTETSRVFVYHTWAVPLEPSVASLAVCGLLPLVDGLSYRFENALRSDQKYLRGFTSATPSSRSYR